MSSCKRLLYAAFDVVPAPKGASRHITYFTQALVQAGYEVTLITAGVQGLPAKDHYSGARMIRIQDEEPNFLRRAFRFGDAVWEHLRLERGRYDLVHFRDIWSGGAAVAAKERFGYSYVTLFEANGLPSVELKYHYPALVGSDLPDRLRRQERQLLDQVEAVVCVSAVTAIYLRSLGAASDQVTVIPNGVDPATFPRAEGPPAYPPRLVYVGTLAPWQGIETVLRAMPMILGYFAEAELHLIGPTKRRQGRWLAKLARKLELDETNVYFHEAIDPEMVADQLEAATICLAPLALNDRNISQGCCPIKLLEYAAVGRPILAGDLPVARELLGENEACFFPPDDAEACARRVMQILLDYEAAIDMGERAADRIRKEFTWQRSGQRLVTLYRRLLPQAAARTSPAERSLPERV